MAVKKEKKESKIEKIKRQDYLWHLVFFVLGICAGLLYYRMFLVDYYPM
ncbi:MAG: hypothetical protein KBD46_00675 [Candidatus Levybacteria bacterium]|nr:hypothetical protein [Candidatus Levybacteria bacterium]